MDSTAKKVADRFKGADSDMSVDQAFKVLGVPKSASFEEVTKAFQQLMRTNHPDVNKSPDATAKSAQITKAYRIVKEYTQGGTPMGRTPGSPPGGWRPEDKVKKDEPKVIVGKSFQEAKRDLPSSVMWKFRTDRNHRDPTPAAKEQGAYYVSTGILYGQSASHHVFVLVEYTTPNSYATKQMIDWEMSVQHTYPLSMDPLKIIPKVFKQMLSNDGKNSLAGKVNFRMCYLLEGATSSTLTEKMLTTSSGRLSFQDALIGAGIVSGASSDRMPVIEIEGKYNPEKRKKAPPGTTLARDSWSWYDFTLTVNGKAHRLSDKSVFNMMAHESTNKEARLIGFGVFQYEWDQRKVLTKLKGGSMKLPAVDALRCLESGLEGEPGDITVAILKAIEILEGQKKQAALWRQAVRTAVKA